MHEDLSRRQDAKQGSDRAFGYVMAAASLLIALSPLRHHLPVRLWALALGITFAGFALIWPRALRPLNAGWMAVGRALSLVTSPLLMGLVFYIVILPTGLLMRIAGRDPLRLARDTGAASYWRQRTATDRPSSMTEQF